MSEVDISVGTELHAALGTPPTYDKAGFDDVSLEYDEVGEVGSIPEFGGEGQVAEWIPLKTGEVDKRTGSINYGSMTIPLAMLYGDAGQDALQSGFDGANARKVHSFKLNKPSVGEIFFTGVITGYRFNPGDANQITQASVTINLTKRPLPVAAA